MPKPYPVQLEVAGPLALFCRPDTGATPTSYPAPTWSAAKGIFESIAFFSDGKAWICPTKVEVCRRISDPGGQVNYQRYTTNYRGPLRKKGLVTGGNSMQLYATVLSNVCFRLHGMVLGDDPKGQKNPKHHLQDLFDRRVKRGQCHKTPALGWSEFACTYWGPFQTDQTEVDTNLSLNIPSMLFNVWSNPLNGDYNPHFLQDVEIKHGVLEYSPAAIGDELAAFGVMRDA